MVVEVVVVEIVMEEAEEEAEEAAETEEAVGGGRRSEVQASGGEPCVHPALALSALLHALHALHAPLLARLLARLSSRPCVSRAL